MKTLLPLVSKPVRYLGREINAIQKDPSQVKLRFCLAFPDVYEVGMSHLGLQILYHLLNAKKEVACERVFAPWSDMERLLREKEAPLTSLESSTPLRQFDILGFSLQYELSFTNLLNILDLSGIPFYARERDERFPLVIAGGPTVFNPEPVADFFDAIVIGDGEEVALEICDLVLAWKEAGGKKDDLLKALSEIKGLYVPTLFRGQKVQKRIVPDLNLAPFPHCPIVPYMRVVHDRLCVEIARGCKRGCRFCEAGFIYRPYRERDPNEVLKILESGLKQTGYEEVSLLSLSAGDYSSMTSLLSRLMDRLEAQHVAVSFPSLRIETIVGQLAEMVKRVRKTGFTIAPEAATERLRRVINKEMDETVLFQGIGELFRLGWKNLKLYFMIGLPTEREEDLRAILDLSQRISAQGERKKASPQISISVSTFVPKPHTPFQWESPPSLPEVRAKLQYLKENLKKRPLRLKWQDPRLSLLEGIFSMGDRSLSRVLVEAHQLGCRFDGWSDQFRFDLWQRAFERAGLEMAVLPRKKAKEDPLPWSFIDTGIQTEFLWTEYQRALNEEVSPPCQGERCHRCGLCDGKEITLREAPSLPLEPTREGGQREGRRRGLRTKFRVAFMKKGESRWISHLELATVFYRAARRAGLPLCHSEGFHPMPRIVFEKALPVGVESLREWVEIELEGRIKAKEVMEKLNQHLPEGIEILEAKEILFPFSSPPQPQRSVYQVTLDHLLTPEEARSRLNRTLQQQELYILQERKERQRRIDLLPMIERVEVKEGSGEREGEAGTVIELVLRSHGGRMAKPTEALEALLHLEGEALARCRIVKLE